MKRMTIRESETRLEGDTKRRNRLTKAIRKARKEGRPVTKMVNKRKEMNKEIRNRTNRLLRRPGSKLVRKRTERAREYFKKEIFDPAKARKAKTK